MLTGRISTSEKTNAIYADHDAAIVFELRNIGHQAVVMAKNAQLIFHFVDASTRSLLAIDHIKLDAAREKEWHFTYNEDCTFSLVALQNTHISIAPGDTYQINLNNFQFSALVNRLIYTTVSFGQLHFSGMFRYLPATEKPLPRLEDVLSVAAKVPLNDDNPPEAVQDLPTIYSYTEFQSFVLQFKNTSSKHALIAAEKDNDFGYFEVHLGESHSLASDTNEGKYLSNIAVDIVQKNDNDFEVINSLTDKGVIRLRSRKVQVLGTGEQASVEVSLGNIFSNIALSGSALIKITAKIPGYDPVSYSVNLRIIPRPHVESFQLFAGLAELPVDYIAHGDTHFKVEVGRELNVRWRTKNIENLELHLDGVTYEQGKLISPLYFLKERRISAAYFEIKDISARARDRFVRFKLVGSPITLQVHQPTITEKGPLLSNFPITFTIDHAGIEDSLQILWSGRGDQPLPALLFRDNLTNSPDKTSWEGWDIKNNGKLMSKVIELDDVAKNRHTVQPISYDEFLKQLHLIFMVKIGAADTQVTGKKEIV